MVMPVPDSTRLLMFPVAQMNILIIKYNLYANLKMIGEKKNSYPLGHQFLTCSGVQQRAERGTLPDQRAQHGTLPDQACVHCTFVGKSKKTKQKGENFRLQN